MRLVPWKKREGMHPLVDLQREMNRLFEDFFGRGLLPEPFRGAGKWRPAVDVVESDDAVTVKAELPGMTPDDIEINLSGDTLSIKGEKKEEKETQGKEVHRVERSYGSFERVVRLPVAVKSGEAEATFKNGVLTVELPKTEESKRKEIKIEIHE